MNNFFDVAHAHGKAANRGSAMAVSGGESYAPSHGAHEDFDTPPLYLQKHEIPNRIVPNQVEEISDFYGFKNFRLTVLGLAAVKAKNHGARYVCKCSCGMYCYRTMRQMKNREWQSCGVCRRNFCRTRKEMGNKVADAVVWARMGGA